MIELRRLLQAYLATIHPRVYFESAPDDALYPYLVVDFAPSFSDGEGLETVPVEIDGWDAPVDGNTTVLEQLMKSVNGNGNIKSPTGLDKRTLTDGQIYATFYLDSKATVTDPDPRIKRRQYRYQAKVFEI